MLMIAYLWATSGFSSMLSFTTRSSSVFSRAISSTMGETMWQGTHHSAQKSTSTGLSDCRTVLLESPSVT